MKTLTLVSLLLFLGLPASAQVPDPEQAGLEQLSQMAALMPSSADFDDTWRAYVSDFISDMDEAEAVIEQISQGASAFRQQVRAPGGNSGAAMKGYQLREKLRTLAAEVLGVEVPEN
jgi:hypothetical protein